MPNPTPIPYRLPHHSAADWPDHVEVPARTLAYVDQHVRRCGDDACWPYHSWTTSTVQYSSTCWQIKRKRFKIQISRLVLIQHLDRPIRPGMYALHRCNNSQCCNPNHIYEGTQIQNRQDRVKLISDLRAGNVVPFASPQDRASYSPRRAAA